MGAFLTSIVALVVLGVGSMYVLDMSWKRADQAFTTTGARVSDPGTNLVGKNWYSSEP